MAEPLTQEQLDLIAASKRMQLAVPAETETPATATSTAVPVPAKPLTPEQEQILADLKAARAQKEAQRVRLEAGGIGQQLQDQGIALARGSGRGIAAIADLPPVVGTGIGNIVNRIEGDPLDNPRNLFDSSAPPAPVTALYDKYVGGVNPKYPEVEHFGEMFGPTAVTLGLANPAASIIGTGTRAAVMTAGAKGGQELVGGIGEKLFGEPGRTYGDIIGAIGGGGIVPPLAGAAATRAANKILTVPEKTVPGGGFRPGAGGSKNWLQAAEELGISKDMSLDLIGNKLSQVLADIATYIPFAGKPVRAARVRQGAALDKVHA